MVKNNRLESKINCLMRQSDEIILWNTNIKTFFLNLYKQKREFVLFSNRTRIKVNFMLQNCSY